MFKFKLYTTNCGLEEREVLPPASSNIFRFYLACLFNRFFGRHHSVTQPSQSSLISWHLRAKKILRLRGLGVLFIREAYLFTGAEYGGIFKAFFFITDKAR